MALHIAAWVVLLLVSANTLVLDLSGLYGFRHFSFRRSSRQRQSAAAPNPGNGAAAAAGTAAAEAAAAAAAGFRAKRGIASGLDSIDDIATLSPALSWYYNWGTMPVRLTPTLCPPGWWCAG